MSHFHVPPHHIHLKWNRSLKPIHTLSPGETITLPLLDGGHNQITPTSTASSLATFNFARTDPAIGPLFIETAKPGDVLKISIQKLTTASYGWTAIFPSSLNFGLLADEYPSPHLKIWDLETHASDGYAVFKAGIHVPIRPFLGVIGVAPELEGEFSTIPPYDTGGNMDCKYLTEGATLYLPVKVEGALLSLGDGHAAQGDGEVCGTAIETPMTATITVDVVKGKDWITSPSYESVEREARGKEYAVLGIDSDLREASRRALRGLIAWLVNEKGLSREEAYVLASVAADLKIAEAVDMPNYAVACSLPLSVFVGKPYV